MPPGKTKGRTAAPGERWITVRVPQEAYGHLEQIAEHQERSVSYIVRKMVLRALEQGVPRPDVARGPVQE